MQAELAASRTDAFERLPECLARRFADLLGRRERADLRLVIAIASWYASACNGGQSTMQRTAKVSKDILGEV